MSRLSRFVLFAILIVAAIAAILSYRYKGQTVHSPSVVADAPRPPITVQGVAEPGEMLVEPFPAYAPTETEKMLGDAMKEARGNSDPNALLAALNRILGKYPDYAGGYAIRLGILCSGKDRAAILSDISNAVKYEKNSAISKETRAGMLSMKAKTEHDAGDDAGALRDLDTALGENIADGTRFTNSGAVAPEKSASPCTWSESDIDELKQRYPSDYRAYLYAGLYYGFFSTWNEPSVKLAMDNLDKAAELSPSSALPHFFKAHILQQAFFLKSMNMSHAQRGDLHQRLLGELNKALALDANLQAALSDRAEVYFSLKQYRQAIPDYDKVITLDSKNAGAFNDRALAKIELGQTYDAISDFGEAIRLKPRELQKSDSYENRADAYMKTQQWPHAIQDLTTAISLQTGGVLILMNINQFRAIYPEYKPASDDEVKERE